MKQTKPETLAELLAALKQRERRLERRINAYIEADRRGGAEERAAALNAVVRDGRFWFGASEELASAICRAGQAGSWDDDEDDDLD